MNSQARVKIIDPYFRKDGARSASRWDYAMEFPVNNRWLRSISDRKKISIRKFSVYPITNYFYIFANSDGADFVGKAVWSPGTSTFDFLETITGQMNDWLEGIDPNAKVNFRLSSKGELVIATQTNIKIEIPIDSRRLLNQVIYTVPIDPSNPDGPRRYAIDPNDKYPPSGLDHTNGNYIYLLGPGIHPLYVNVWDRQRIYMHASFSQARNNYVCEMNETFINGMEKDFNYNAAQFDVWFSRDGKTPFKLNNDNFMFELQFTAKEQEFKR